MNRLDALNKASLKKGVPSFRTGDTVKVHVKVIEGTRSRIQLFQGVVIRKQGAGISEAFTVRKVSFGTGVERTFPIHTPTIDKIAELELDKYVDGFSTGTSHGVLYNYDAHIPLLFWGKGIQHKTLNTPTFMTDIAPTITTLLGIQMPSGSIGKPIVEILK